MVAVVCTDGSVLFSDGSVAGPADEELENAVPSLPLRVQYCGTCGMLPDYCDQV